MGKSNRIRVNRANERISSLGVKKKGNGMPSWAMTLITVVVAAALLFGVAAILLTANGVFGRMTTAIYSDNYKVTQNMLQYYFNTEYQNFISSYESYLTTSSTAGTLSLNSSLPLKDQKFGGDGTTTNYDTLFCGEFEGTWYDYFLENTVESVKGMLVYCEYAKANNITLTDEEKEEIEANIEMYETYAELGGWPSAGALIASEFGEGISVGDVRDCLELSTLANKARNAIAEKLEGSVKDQDVTDRYNSNTKLYNVVDYTYYTFTVNYDDVVEEVLGKSDASDAEIKNKKAEILEAYKAAIEEVRNEAKALDETADIEAFRLYIYNKVATEAAEENYAKQTIADDIKPTIDGVTDLKAYFVEKIAADVVAEILEGKETGDVAVELPEEEDTEDTDTDTNEADAEKKDEATYEVYGATVKESFAKILNTVKSSVFSSTLSAKTKYNSEKVTYVNDENKVSVWAFGADAKAGSKLTLNSYDGADDDGKAVAADKITEKNGQAVISVYRLVKEQYKNTEKSKNFTYMVFSKEDDAKAAIKAINEGKTFTAEALEKIAEEKEATTVQSVTDYEKGSFGSTDFDNWLYDENTTAGTITATAIKADSSYIVALYEGEGNEQWYLDVKEVIFTELAEAEAEKLEKDYPVTEKEKTYAKINVAGQE